MHSHLVSYLKDFITEERFNLFTDVVQHRTKHISYVIEDVFQPHNASAVVRSCDCFGIQDLHIIENTNTYKTDKNIALGASKWVSIHKYNDAENVTKNCLTHLKKKGFKIVATSPHELDVTPQTIDLSQPLAIVFGKEKEGISETVKQEADIFMKIPMYGFTESLNISVAAAIIAQSLYSRLITSDVNWILTEAQRAEVLVEWLSKSIKNSSLLLDSYFKNNPKLPNSLA
ncbi:MAG: TrmH family RNA methyltransferase [Flavobacteriales bacterium]